MGMGPLILALMFSAAAAAGSLYLSLGMDLNACALCFYQRALAFALVTVLGVGLVVLGEYKQRLVAICLPLAVAGLGVAGFHTYLVGTGKLECPLGVAGIGPAPAQSLVVFALVVAALVYGFLSDMRANGFAPVLLALGLGGAAAYGLVMPGVNPPAKQAKKPTEPGERLVECQAPYREPAPE